MTVSTMLASDNVIMIQSQRKLPKINILSAIEEVLTR